MQESEKKDSERWEEKERREEKLMDRSVTTADPGRGETGVLGQNVGLRKRGGEGLSFQGRWGARRNE